MTIVKADFGYDLEMTIKGRYLWTVKIWDNWESKPIRPYSKKDYALYKEIIKEKDSHFDFACDTNNDFLIVTVTNQKHGVFVFRFDGGMYRENYRRYYDSYLSWVKFRPQDKEFYSFSIV